MAHNWEQKTNCLFRASRKAFVSLAFLNFVVRFALFLIKSKTFLEIKFELILSKNVSTLSYLENFTGQRDGMGFPGNDKNLSRDRRLGNNGKLQSLRTTTRRKYKDVEARAQARAQLISRLKMLEFENVLKNRCSFWKSGVHAKLQDKIQTFL